MASKSEIKKVILNVAGNPESGAIAQLADEWAEAIYRLDNPAPHSQEKEKRVIKATETR